MQEKMKISKKKTGKAVWLSNDVLENIISFTKGRFSEKMANRMTYNSALLEAFDYIKELEKGRSLRVC